MRPVARGSASVPVRRTLRARFVPRSNVLDLRTAPTTPAPTTVPRRTASRRNRPRAGAVHRVLGAATAGLPPVRRAGLLARLYSVRSVATFVLGATVLTGVLTLGPAFATAQDRAGEALVLADAAVADLQRAATALAEQRWGDARNDATASATAFREAEARLAAVPGSVRMGLAITPVLGSRYRGARALAHAGERFATAVDTTAGVAQRTLGTGGSVPPAAVLAALPELVPAIDAAEEGTESLATVDPDAFPGTLGTLLESAHAQLPLARSLLGELRAGTGVLPELLGFDGSREYLVLFQNAAERRATGGFLGSLLGIRFDRGTPTVTDAPGRGPYDVDDVLPAVTPPSPILRVTNRWTLHDSNWSPDFPTAAAKALAFYEEARGFRVDGVLAFTSTLLPELLRITGPLTLADGTVLTAEDALATLQHRVEVGYDRASNQPKAVVGQLFVALNARMATLAPADLFRFAVLLRDGARARDVQIFAKDAALEARVAAAGWDGAVQPGTFDTLAVVGANLGGGKSDSVIDDTLTLDVSIADNGSVTNTATLIRNHRGVPSDPLAGLTNRSYLRFLLPRGVTVADAYGFTAPDPGTFFGLAENARRDPDAAATATAADGPGGTRIQDDLGLTSVGGWLDLPPQESAAVRVRYRLPEAVPAVGWLSSARTYRLHLIRQSGTQAAVTIRLRLPEGAEPVYASHELTELNGAFETSFRLERDSDLTVLYR